MVTLSPTSVGLIQNGTITNIIIKIYIEYLFDGRWSDFTYFVFMYVFYVFFLFIPIAMFINQCESISICIPGEMRVWVEVLLLMRRWNMEVRDIHMAINFFDKSDRNTKSCLT